MSESLKNFTETDLQKFVAWFLGNAKPNKGDQKLNVCARTFIEYLIKEYEKKYGEKYNLKIDDKLKITSMEVYNHHQEIDNPKQRIDIRDKNKNDKLQEIDFCVNINKKYFIIIELKSIFTHEHNNQLVRYIIPAKEWCEKEELIPIPIYLKIGTTEPKTLIKGIESKEKEFKYISLSNLIEEFEKYKLNDEIFSSYLKNFKEIEKAGIAYTKMEIEEWSKKAGDADENKEPWPGLKWKVLEQDKKTREWKVSKQERITPKNAKIWECWRGFYSDLASTPELKNTDWGKRTIGGEETSGQSDAYLFWCDETSKETHLKLDKNKIYLRFEQGPLCFRTDTNDKMIKKTLYNLLKEKLKDKISKELDPEKLIPNNRKKNLIAEIEFKDWLGGNKVDEKKVVKKLEGIREAVEKALKS